ALAHPMRRPLPTPPPRPIRPAPSRAAPPLPPCQIGEPVQRGYIAPVQIFEPEHQRPLGRQCFHRLRHLPQHPLPRRALNLPWQALTLRCTEECGHLDQPGGRILAQEYDEPVAAGRATQSSHRLQYWHVPFARAVVLDALPAPDPHPPLGCNLCQKRFHYCRLANPRLTADEDKLTLAT